MSLFKSIIGSAAVLAVVSMFSGSAMAAGTASFSLSPSRSSVAQSETFSVSISENGTNVNAVTAQLAFDASKVQLVGIACGASFPGTIAEANGITCYTAGGTVVNGSAGVATAQFKALANAGTASVSITTGSKIASAGVDTWNGVNSATSVQLTAPATTAATPGRGAGASTAPAASSASRTSTTTSGTTNSAATNSTPATPAAADTKTADAKKTVAVTAVSSSNPTKPSSKVMPWVITLALIAAVAAAVYFTRKRMVANTDEAIIVAPTVKKAVSKGAAVGATATTAKKATRKTAAKKK
jgi:hypothetical protein